MAVKIDRRFYDKATPAQRLLVWLWLSEERPVLYAWIKEPHAGFVTKEEWGRHLEYPAMVAKVEQCGKTEYVTIDIGLLAAVFDRGGLPHVEEFVRAELFAWRESMALAS